MKTRVLKNLDLSLAAESLMRGCPAVFPTETVYGLGAPIFNEMAVRQIFTIKGRPADNPLIAHIRFLVDAELLSDELPPEFYALAEAFWPGPLAIVVRRNSKVPALVSAGQPTIAIRMPSHPIALELIERVGEPLVAPSANLSGSPSPTCIQDVLEDLDGKIEFAIDGGPCQIGIESTVISLFHSSPTLLRPGNISREAIERVLGKQVLLPPNQGPILSPGMKYRHYAPKAPVRLIFNRDELRGPFIVPTQKTIYADLRKWDRMGVNFIEIYCDEAVQKDEALMNRLLRSSGVIS